MNSLLKTDLLEYAIIRLEGRSLIQKGIARKDLLNQIHLAFRFPKKSTSQWIMFHCP